MSLFPSQFSSGLPPRKDAALPISAPISPWEWAPLALLPLLLAFRFLAQPGGARLFATYVALGLIPGALWRLTGRSAWFLHRLGFALALVAYLFTTPSLHPPLEDLQELGRHWRLVLLGVVFALSQPLWGALRLGRLLADSGGRLGYAKTLRVCLAGFFFNQFLPGSTAGDLYRIYALAGGRRRHFPTATAAISLDRCLGMPPMFLMLILAALAEWDFVFGSERLATLLTFVASASLVLLFLLFLLWLAHRRLRGTPPAGEKPGWIRRVHDTLASNLSRSATLPLVLAYGLFSHVATVLACLCFATAIGVTGIPAGHYFLLVPLAMAVNAIPGAPGGLGQGEIAMATLFDLAAPGAGNAGAGVTVMFILRLANLVSGLLGGVLYALGKTVSAGEEPDGH